MRIAFIGNCQAQQVGTILQIMCPKEDICVLSPQSLGANANCIRDVELVISNDRFADGPVARLKKENDFAFSITKFPSFFFTGYHPDLIFSRTEVNAVPMGNCHSAICVHGFASGWTVEQTIRNFNKDVFRHLGYFDHWQTSVDALTAQGRNCAFPIEHCIESWRAEGVFMTNPRHPKLFVLIKISHMLAESLDLQVSVRYPENFLLDELVRHGPWPVFPEIAEALGVKGEYAFRLPRPTKTSRAKIEVHDLTKFIEDAYATYARQPAENMLFERLKDPRYGELRAGDRVVALGATDTLAATRNPYHGLPDRQFWRRGVSSKTRSELDPVSNIKFKFDRSTRISTAGSCFAQHVARALRESGYRYYITEDAPVGLSQQEARKRNFSVFSARYGNIYTARQMLQTFQRAYGDFEPAHDTWERCDRRFIDPFRPEIEPSAFASPTDLRASRADHFAAIRTMFETLDVFVFTLGLTEAWRSRHDGAVVPIAPGVVKAVVDGDDFEFVNFTVDEVRGDLAEFITLLRSKNEHAKIILTVSPVPLVATFMSQHVLTATTYSKAVLRTAADDLSRQSDSIDYFPSYEIITGPPTRGHYYQADARTVTEEGVAHVMGLFIKHYGGATASRNETSALHAELIAGQAVVCEEELLDG